MDCNGHEPETAMSSTRIARHSDPSRQDIAKWLDLTHVREYAQTLLDQDHSLLQLAEQSRCER
jgi:hypothetical protein